MRYDLKDASSHFELTRAGQHIIYVDELGGMISVTYSALKTLRDTSALVPGMQYRITDYHCSTTQTDTSTADNRFDIIVTADSSTVLNENARAMQHTDSSTDYFAKCNLNAWELKYSLDNDKARFAWAKELKSPISHEDVIKAYNNADGVPYIFVRQPNLDSSNGYAWAFSTDYYYSIQDWIIDASSNEGLGDTCYTNSPYPSIGDTFSFYGDLMTVVETSWGGVSCTG